MTDQDPPAGGIVTRTSTGSVAQCIERLRLALEANGLTVFAEFDHSSEARARGLELRDTQVVVFGNPVTGTPVMQAVPLVALDLPLKVLIYDDGGTTTLAYLSPEALQARYAIPAGLAASLRGIDAIAEAAAAA
ncbi:MAG: DUF302 domain-containing protein [Solirubrobacterales bacterium]|nr:DUF302 domain-containing protein [Solirubrobacterales bacterium]